MKDRLHLLCNRVTYSIEAPTSAMLFVVSEVPSRAKFLLALNRNRLVEITLK